MSSLQECYRPTGSSERRRVALPDAALEVKIRGSGEPVVMIQTALTADEFLPVARQPEIRDNFMAALARQKTRRRK